VVLYSIAMGQIQQTPCNIWEQKYFFGFTDEKIQRLGTYHLQELSIW
jgi:hypothetical protein